MEFCPFKGLLPYSEKDERYFFGRTTERRVIRDNLCASRLTVLYGPSGVGKSSVLGAGVVHDLRKDPDYVVVYFGTQGAWRSEPVAGLNTALHDSLTSLPGFQPNGNRQPPPGLFPDLPEQLEKVDRTLLVILDQFEEYFQYHPNEAAETDFVRQFPSLLCQANLPVHFLLSLREDSLAVLHRFKKYIPNLFNNRLRIDFLSREGALEAVIKPLDVFNQEDQPPGPMTMQKETAEQLVDRLARAQKSDKQQVQTPYLQLVMENWWHREVKDGSHEMREETLQALGGVETIVDRHLEATLKQLGPDAENLAASLFEFMVTPGGRKIAQTSSELAERAAKDYPATAVKELLQKLRDSRVLTTVPLPPDSKPGEQCYEFAHDVMARAALDWGNRHVQTIETAVAQREAEEAKKREQAAHRQVIKFRTLAFGLAAVLLLAIAASALAWREGRLSAAGELIRAATSQLDADPELSILLGLRADRILREQPRLPADVLKALLDSLNLAVQTSRVRKTLELDRADDVYDITFSQNRKMIATSGPQGVIKIWDTHTGRKLYTLGGEDKDGVSSLSFSLDGMWLATADWEGHVKVWEISSEKKMPWPLPPLPDNEGRVTNLAFSPKGEQLATGTTTGGVLVWSGTSGKSQLLGKHDGGVGVLAFSTNGERLATGGDDNTIKIWDPQAGKLVLTLQGHKGSINALALSDDGKYLASGGSDTTVRLWDLVSGKEIRTLWRGGNYVFSLAFNRDGTRLAAGGFDGTAVVWDVNSGRELLSLSGHKGPIQSIAFSPDEEATVLTGSWDKTVKVWDVPQAHSGAIPDLAFSPKGDLLATVSFDSTVKLWDTNSQHTSMTLTPSDTATHSQFFSVAFSPNGRIFATCDFDDRVRIWDSSTGRQLSAWKAPDSTGMSFSPDGTRLVMGGAGSTGKVVDARTGKILVELHGHTDRINDVIFSPDGKLLASASADYSARVWDSSSGKPKFALPMDPSGEIGHKGRLVWVAFSPDSTRLATASEDHMAKIWDFNSDKVLSLKGHTNVIEGVAFSHDGKYVATAGVDGTARVWDAQTGVELHRFVHPRGVESVAFSPDGKHLATGSDDGRMRIFILDREELVRLARDRVVTRHWTEEECQEYLHVACPRDPKGQP